MHKFKVVTVILGALSAGSAVALLVLFQLKKSVYGPVGGYIFDYLTYYIVFALVGMWIAQIVIVLRNRQFSMLRFLARQWPELLIAFAATITVFWSVPPQFRVLSDEADLISMSETMLYEKAVYKTTMAKYYFGNIQPIHVAEVDRDKRPVLFSFFTHLLHVVRGFQYQNAFLCNGILLFALLAMAAVVAQRFVGRLAAAAAVILLAGYPLISLYATCAGFDFIAAFFLALVFVLLAAFMREPRADLFALLWITALVLAHSRYESGLAFVAIAFLLLVLQVFGLSPHSDDAFIDTDEAGEPIAPAPTSPTVTESTARKGYMEPEYFFQHSWIFILTPWFLVPLVLQYWISGGTFENTTGTPNFGPQHFADNSWIALNTMSDLGRVWTLLMETIRGAPITWTVDKIQPYPIWFNDLSIVLLCALFVGVIRRNALWHRQFMAIAVVIIAGFLCVHLSYYFGNCSHPASARMFVFYGIVLAMAPVAFSYFYPKIINSYVLMAIAVASACLYHPIAVENRFSNTATLIRETDAQMEFLKTVPGKNVLIVCDRPVDFTALGYGAITFTYANEHYNEINAEFNQHLYTILVMQRIGYTTNWPLADNRFDAPYNLKIVKQQQISGSDDSQTGGCYIRISWVGGVTP